MGSELANCIGLLVTIAVVTILGLFVPPTMNWLSQWKFKEWKRSKLRKADEQKIDLEVVLGEPQDGGTDWPSVVLGTVERLLFLGALWLQIPILVAAWLGLKVASKWQSWALAKTQDELGIPQRSLALEIGYLRFLVGTGLNLVYVLLAYGIGLWIARALAS